MCCHIFFHYHSILFKHFSLPTYIPKIFHALTQTGTQLSNALSVLQQNSNKGTYQRKHRYSCCSLLLHKMGQGFSLRWRWQQVTHSRSIFSRTANKFATPVHQSTPLIKKTCWRHQHMPKQVEFTAHKQARPAEFLHQIVFCELSWPHKKARALLDNNGGEGRAPSLRYQVYSQNIYKTTQQPESEDPGFCPGIQCRICEVLPC